MPDENQRFLKWHSLKCLQQENFKKKSRLKKKKKDM